MISFEIFPDHNSFLAVVVMHDINKKDQSIFSTELEALLHVNHVICGHIIEKITFASQILSAMPPYDHNLTPAKVGSVLGFLAHYKLNLISEVEKRTVFLDQIQLYIEAIHTSLLLAADVPEMNETIEWFSKLLNSITGKNFKF